MWETISFGLRAVAAFAGGFLLPGFLVFWLLARHLPKPGLIVRSAAAFVISLLILFHLVLWSAIAGLPLTAGTIGIELILLMAGLVGSLFIVTRRDPVRTGPPEIRTLVAPKERGLRLSWAILMTFVCLIGAAMLLRTWLWPLAGADTTVRWDFLATQILKHQSLGFYPPVSAADFRIYFYADGIPPLVSISYWWLYAAVGEHARWLTWFLVVGQYFAIIIFVYGLARAMHSPIAGAMAASVLASSALFTWSVAIGQETGLTALSLVAMMYFLVQARTQPGSRWRWMILAGTAAALGALSREYGLSFVFLGVVAVLWLRLGWRMTVPLCITALLIALPWYIRNLIRTGNPVYDIRLGPFRVNPVHAGIFDLYVQTLGVGTWGWRDWGSAALMVIQDALVPCLVGLVACIWSFRRWGFFSVAILLVVLLWLNSVGYTSGGMSMSLRVLSPAIALLSVLAGVLLAGTAKRAIAFKTCTVLLACAGLWGLVAALAHPLVANSLVLRNLGQVMVSRWQPGVGWPEQVPSMLPAGSTVLTDNPFVATALAEHSMQAVPVWSPEVAFLMDESVAPQQARRYLKQLGIRYVVAQNQLNLRYLVNHMRMYQEDTRNWRVIGSIPNEAWVMELPE